MSTKRAVSPRMYRFTVVIEAAEEGGYYAFCPLLPGCYSQGETLEQTRTNIREAIQCHLEGLVKDRQPIPEESEEFVGTIQVTVPNGR